MTLLFVMHGLSNGEPFNVPQMLSFVHYRQCALGATGRCSIKNLHNPVMIISGWKSSTLYILAQLRSLNFPVQTLNPLMHHLILLTSLANFMTKCWDIELLS